MSATTGAAQTPMRAPGNDDVDMDAVGLFLETLMPEGASKKPPPEPKEEETHSLTAEEVAKLHERQKPEPEEKPEPSAEEPEDEEDEQEDQETKEEERKLADDGAYVKIKVGDEEHEVPVKELSRLYGQEQSLTKKSMALAEQRTKSDAQMASNVAAHTALLERAQKRFEPYQGIDFNLAAAQLSPEEYTNLRDAARAAYEDVQFLQTGLNQVITAAQQRQTESLVEQAKNALEVLTGPVDQGGVEGWNEELYEKVRAFGIEAGLKKEVVDNLVDPAAISLLHDAMLFRRGTQNKVVTVRKNKTPTKVIKTRQAPETSSVAGDQAKAQKAMKRLAATGETDDAAAALLAGWAARDADLS